MKDFNSNCINSENAFSNAYNRQFGGEIFFLLSAFQEGCAGGCTQYHFGMEGVIKSFNFEGTRIMGQF